MDFRKICIFWLIAGKLIYVPAMLQAKELEHEIKGKYVLSRAPYSNEVCERFTDNLNMFSKLNFDECHRRMSDKFPEFSRPYVWEEIPFDLTLAEKAIKSGMHPSRNESGDADYYRTIEEKRWQEWLESTKGLRQAGKVKMWTTRIDTDKDGELETLLRLEPGGRFRYDPKQQKKYHCDYDRGELYVVETKHAATADQFNFMVKLAADIIYDSADDVYYLLEWSRWRAPGPGRSHLPEQGPIPNIGATRGVVVQTLSPRHGPNSYSPGVDICVIDWIPTGKYKPVSKNWGE